MDKPTKHRIILRCLHETYPAEMAMIGADLADRIIDDALSGTSTEFRSSRGGYNFDVVACINTVIATASLLVALAQYYADHKTRLVNKHPSPTPNGREKK